MQSTPQRRYQQLQPEDRVKLASLVQRNFGVREMALAMGRSACTISRELRRNAQPAGYASATARACTQQRRKQGRSPNKLHRDSVLFGVVRHFLKEQWSPEQIALTLAAIYPKQLGGRRGTPPRPASGSFDHFSRHVGKHCWARCARAVVSRPWQQVHRVRLGHRALR
jgi:hypothetical protein